MRKTKKSVRQNVIYVVLSVLIILIIHIVYQCIMLLRKPTNSMLVKNGHLINYEEVVGYVIRDEEIIDTSEYSGKRQTVIADASRVAAGSTIVSYVSENQDGIEEKIAELDVEIQKLMETQETVYLADVRNIESEIQQNLYSILSTKNNIYEVIQQKKKITESLEKKASIVGEKSPTGSKLNSLITERMEYEKQLNESKKDLKAEKAGLISYRVDGYENILTPNIFSKLSIAELEKIKIAVNQTIPINNDEVKIINNFYCYLVVPMKSAESKELVLNDTVKISFDGNLDDYERANVEYISEEGDTRLVVLKTTSNIEELTQYRKVSLDIIWWNYQGLKVSNEAIYEKEIVDEITGETYATLFAVQVQEAGYQKEVWVKVEKSVDGFSIIENYEDDELIEMGIPEELVDSRYDVSLYDEVIIHGEDTITTMLQN